METKNVVTEDQMQLKSYSTMLFKIALTGTTTEKLSVERKYPSVEEILQFIKKDD